MTTFRHRSLVEQLSEPLRSSLVIIKEHVSALWSNGDRIHPCFTLHGVPHLRNVELRAEELLAVDYVARKVSDVVKEQELFYLLAAIWLHDIGMIVPATLLEQKLATERGSSVADFIRAEHHKRSRTYIVARQVDLGLTPDQAEVIGIIAEAHRRVTLVSLPHKFPDIRFLAALLRIADELDISRSRAPLPLLKLLWPEMDTEAQWHWCKQWAVADVHHVLCKTLDGSPARLVSAYQCTLAVPDAAYFDPLWHDILRPVVGALKDDGVDMILAAKGVFLDIDQIIANPVVCSLDTDGVSMSEVVRRVYGDLGILPKSMSDSIRKLGLHSPTVAKALTREVEHLCLFLSRGGNWRLPLSQCVDEFVRCLATARNAKEVEALYEAFMSSYQELCKMVPTTVRDRLDQQWALVGEVGRRGSLLCLGDGNVKRGQLLHLEGMISYVIAELAAELLKSGSGEDLKCAAVRVLRDHPESQFYGEILKASEDASALVREEASRALGRFPAAGALVRLGVMAEKDVVGTVRVAAKRAMLEALRSTQADLKKLTDRKVLVVDTEQEFVSSLVDAVELRGGKIRVAASLSEAVTILSAGFIPDIVVCELIMVEFGTDGTKVGGELPGASIMRELRQKLSEATPFLATGNVQLGVVSGLIADCRAYYKQKPSTGDDVCRTLESLL